MSTPIQAPAPMTEGEAGFGAGQTPASPTVPLGEAGPHSSDADAVGAPASGATHAADLKWLKSAEHWREYERFDEETGRRESIWLMKSKSSPEARFYAPGKGQVGGKHHSIVAATCWAYGTGYLGVCENPDDIVHEIACRAEVLAGGTQGATS